MTDQIAYCAIAGLTLLATVVAWATMPKSPNRAVNRYRRRVRP